MSAAATWDVERWDVKQVSDFIRGLNPRFGGYAEAFERDAVDGPMLLHDITPGWLEKAVPNEIHRNRISREIKVLALQAVPPAPAIPQIAANLLVPSVAPTVTTHTSIGAFAIGPNATSSHTTITTNQYFNSGGVAADVKAEAYDFSSLIDSKLSDLKPESFGREWLYQSVYDWLIPSPPRPDRQSSLLLVTGEPVWIGGVFAVRSFLCSDAGHVLL